MTILRTARTIATAAATVAALAIAASPASATLHSSADDFTATPCKLDTSPNYPSCGTTPPVAILVHGDLVHRDALQARHLPELPLLRRRGRVDGPGIRPRSARRAPPRRRARAACDRDERDAPHAGHDARRTVIDRTTSRREPQLGSLTWLQSPSPRLRTATSHEDAIAGDGRAFAALYDRHERRAFNLAYRITGSREDAADATQEAFLKLLARLPRLADRELDFGSYLLTAVRHASYDVMARARRAEPDGRAARVRAPGRRRRRAAARGGARPQASCSRPRRRRSARRTPRSRRASARRSRCASSKGSPTTRSPCSWR